MIVAKGVVRDACCTIGIVGKSDIYRTMTVLYQRGSVGPAHNTCHTFVSGSDGSCGVEVTNGTATYIAERSTTWPAGCRDAGISIFPFYNFFRHKVDGQCVSLSVEDTAKSSSIGFVIPMPITNHCLCIAKVDIGRHLGIGHGLDILYHTLQLNPVGCRANLIVAVSIFHQGGLEVHSRT